MDLLMLMEARCSTRSPFDPKRPIAGQDLMRILEAARWSPTPHNMQNFEIMVIDDKPLLKQIGNIKSKVTLDFLKENYPQLSFSKEELVRKKVGILATWFPKEWTDPSKLEEAAQMAKPFPVSETLDGSPMLVIVIYDSRKRAPDSPGDFLGILGLGCVMENMWLMANSLGIAFHIMSEFGEDPVEKEAKRILDIPAYMKIAYACRLGYPVSEPRKGLRVRRDVKDFTHHNRFGSRGLHKTI
jgi:nitroreductase